MMLQMLTPSLAVCGQLKPEDMPALVSQGYKAIICNRPDGEEPGQPTMDEVGRAAEAAGLVYAEFPISGPPTPAHAAGMAELLGLLPQPLVAYCHSGGRSKVAIALAGLLAAR